MKKIQRILVLLLSVIMTVSLISCSEKKKESKKGRYIEEVYNLPEGIKNAAKMKLLDDGSIALLGECEDGKVEYYLSSDKGKTFEKKFEVKTPTVEEGGEVRLSNSYIDNNGELTVLFSKLDAETVKKMNEIYSDESKEIDEEQAIAMDEEIQNKTEYIAKNLDKDGNEKEVNTENLKTLANGEIKLHNDNELLFYNYEEEKLSLLEKETFKKIKDISVEGYLGSFVTIDNSVVVNNYEKVYKYDIKSDKKKDIKSLKKYINDINQMYSGKKDMYFSSSNGLFKYSLEKDKVTKLIDGQLSSFGQDDFYPVDFIEISDKEFLFLNCGEKSTLVHYKYDKNAKSKADKEITVYSLYEDYNIRQAINKYQKQHEDIYINYETGIEYNESGEESITETDAIKALNTKVMAGKGPDIMVLDYLPSDEYIKKGLLEDISDVINKNKDSLFSNIVEAYKSKDNKIYSFPLSINVPIVASGCYDVSKITDLKTFADAVEELATNKGGRVIEAYNATQLIYYLYYSCSASWINEDNKLNNDKIKEFLECAKRIYEANDASISDKERQKYNELLKEISQYTTPEEYDKYTLYGGDVNTTMVSNSTAKLSIGYIYTPDEISVMEGCKEINSNANYSLWNGQISGYFLPQCIVGISSKSKYKEESKDFVESLVSIDLNSDFYSLSPNKEKLIKAIDSKEDGGSWGFADDNDKEYEVECKKLTDAQKDNIIKLIESSKTHAVTDQTILNKTIEDIEKYIIGEESLDKTITEINNKLEIYLAE